MWLGTLRLKAWKKLIKRNNKRQENKDNSNKNLNSLNNYRDLTNKRKKAVHNNSSVQINQDLTSKKGINKDLLNSKDQINKGLTIRTRKKIKTPLPELD